MNGYYNILKPTGMSSAAVVAVMRRLTGEKRVGHAGTLDPEAAGVLPVMTGKATRLFDYLADKEKEYVAVCAFGTATDTQDFTGNVIETGTCYPDRAVFAEAAKKLTGEITQVPSMYSAIKVGGTPLYLKARKGEQVDVPARKVRIDSIELLSEQENHGFEIRVRCGRGTYIRTLCADLGKLCGCPAHMRSLTRTRSGVFGIEDSIPLEEARSLAEQGMLKKRMFLPDYPLGHLPRKDVPAKQKKLVVNGVRLPVCSGDELYEEGKPVRIYLENQFWGIAVRQEEHMIWKALIAPEDISEEMR